MLLATILMSVFSFVLIINQIFEIKCSCRQRKTEKTIDSESSEEIYTNQVNACEPDQVCSRSCSCFKLEQDDEDEYKDMPPLVSSHEANELDVYKSQSDIEHKNLDTSDKIKKISISNIEDRNDDELKQLVRDLKDIIVKYNFNVEVDIFNT